MKACTEFNSHALVNLTAAMNGCFDATRDFLLDHLGCTVRPNRMSLTWYYTFQLETPVSPSNTSIQIYDNEIWTVDLCICVWSNYSRWVPVLILPLTVIVRRLYFASAPIDLLIFKTVSRDFKPRRLTTVPYSLFNCNSVMVWWQCLCCGWAFVLVIGFWYLVFFLCSCVFCCSECVWDLNEN